MIQIGPLETAEEALLPHFLALAAHEDEVESVLINPALAVYVSNWGKPGDCGMVAKVAGHDVVGMSWARFWTKEHHGFGWVDEHTPELAIAVQPEFQGQGVGRMLIQALQECLRGASVPTQNGDVFWPIQVALNVRGDSPAVRFYERLGFVRVEGNEQRNRTGGLSFNMVARL